MKTVLTIAGSDSSGGAGIQADIKTITVHKMYAMSVITALTAQNTMGVDKVLEVPPEFVGAQLDSIFRDIRPDSVKTGMAANSSIISVIGHKLREYKARNVVVDPVMISTSGRRLLPEEAVMTFCSQLLPLADLVTPNLFEAGVLCGYPVKDQKSMVRAAKDIADRYKCRAVLLKGGHLEGEAADLLWKNGSASWFRVPRIRNENTHGTGCTLSSAIACNLAAGKGLEDSVRCGKEYLTGAIGAMLDLGAGNGPLHHFYF